MTDLQKAEMELFEMTQKVAKMRCESQTQEVKNYQFSTLQGEVSLSELFGQKDTLFLIHNMGQACRYCTLWGDGLNGFVPHIENDFAIAMVSKDDPETQRQFANSRGWRFTMASHGGGEYIEEQNVSKDGKNYPGMICYQKEGNRILKKNSVMFGPGDEFSSIWNLLSLGGVTADKWTPQFNYWKRPAKLEDGGENLN